MSFARAAAATTLRRGLCLQCRQTMATRAVLQPAGRWQTPLAKSSNSANVSIRWHSTPATNTKVYDFGAVKEISEAPSSKRILIDVREPFEYEAGFIPTAVNLPIKSQPDAIFLPEEEFEDRFGFEKPTTDKEVIFYCKSGVRSSAAAQLARQQGYTQVAEYRGSWLDWTKNGGASGK